MRKDCTMIAFSFKGSGKPNVYRVGSDENISEAIINSLLASDELLEVVYFAANRAKALRKLMIESGM